MKNWIIENKNISIIFLSILLIQLTPNFGGLSGQYAKVEIALIIGVLIYPIYIYQIMNHDFNKKIYLILFLLIPLFMEIAINLYLVNNSKGAYYDITTISLSILFSLYFFINKYNIEKQKKIVGQLIVALAIIIIIFTIFALIFSTNKTNVGGSLFGNQNIASYLLLVSMPFLIRLDNKFIYKISILFLIFLIIGFVYKSRIPSLISLFYILYCIYNYNITLRKKYIQYLIFTFVLIGILLIFNDRYKNLFNLDIYYRILPFLRFLEGVQLENLIIGYGTQNFAAVFYSFQNIYPVIEIILPSDSFIYAHNFLIDRLVSGGIFTLACYLFTISFLVIKPLTIKDFKVIDDPLYHSLIITLIMGFYDILMNSISGYLFFSLISFMLLSQIIKFEFKINRLILLIMPLFFIVPGIFYKINNKMSHHDLYNKIINEINYGQLNSDTLKDFSNKYPHYAEIDSINAYFYLKNDVNNFDNYFNVMNIYNKYSDKRLHLSSQLYAYKNSEHNLIDVYSDIFLKTLISKNIVTPNYKKSNIVVNVNDSISKLSFVSNPCCNLSLPRDMFNQIKFVNSGLSNLKISEESINFVATNAQYAIDSKDSARDTEVVKVFLREVNKYSEPLKF